MDPMGYGVPQKNLQYLTVNQSVETGQLTSREKHNETNDCEETWDDPI
jgi:hypothetical protein